MLRVLAVIILLAAGVRAERVKVWVVLRDKGPEASAFAPGSRAWEDLPLHQPYLEALARVGFALQAGLKWQNRVSGLIEKGRLPWLRALPGVAGVEGMPRKARGRPLPW